MNFFNQNKVLIVGLLSAVLLALNEVLSKGEANVKTLAFAAFLAALSLLANNLRGQWATIAGILGTAVATYVTQSENGNISWVQIVLQSLLALLAVFTPPAKSRGYEHASTITSAKAEGERIRPSAAK